MKHLHIIKKRKGHKELFDEHKLRGACYRACLNAHLSEKKSEQICGKVLRDVKLRLKGKKLVSSKILNEYVISALKKYDEDAGFLFETHFDVS